MEVASDYDPDYDPCYDPYVGDSSKDEWSFASSYYDERLLASAPDDEKEASSEPDVVCLSGGYSGEYSKEGEYTDVLYAVTEDIFSDSSDNESVVIIN